MASANGPFDLSKAPIHLGNRPDVENPAIPLQGFGFDPPSFEAYIAEHCAPGAPGRLVMVEPTPTDWEWWECHTEADELVIVLEGRGTFIQEVDGAEQRIPVSAGDAIINPRGVWHTADVEEPIRAIYMTPCPGTEHRKRER